MRFDSASSPPAPPGSGPEPGPVNTAGRDAAPPPIPFPAAQAEDAVPARPAPDLTQWPASTDDVLEAFTSMSRRIKDLARELKCLGYFDDDHDQPRAA
jgi:hypothetical protein